MVLLTVSIKPLSPLSPGLFPLQVQWEFRAAHTSILRGYFSSSREARGFQSITPTLSQDSYHFRLGSAS